MDTISKASASKKASIKTSACSTELKNNALIKIADLLNEKKDKIFEANKKDIEKGKENNLSEPMLKRLKFDESKLSDVTSGIESLIKLPDPVGRTLLSTELDKGLELYKVSCPIGVIGIIFESRPDALVQISTLCLKSGNAVLLKGGSEAINTNRELYEIIKEASENAGMPGGWIQFLETREDVAEMLKLDKFIDLIVPRGSNQFVRYIMDNTNIPVLGHAAGICHVYVDRDADMDMAVKIAMDSKSQNVSVCNAAETLLVHEKAADKFLPLLKAECDKKHVLLLGCERTRKIIDIEEASEKDWKTEYLDYKLSVKVVSSIDEAIDHINKFGSKHTDAIITNNKERASKFMQLVDSANVFLNCSTRFSDGYRYGFGAEVGISTSKIHARGPVGLEGLVIYKYKLVGHGQIVSDYVDKRKKFTHRKLNKEFKL